MLSRVPSRKTVKKAQGDPRRAARQVPSCPLARGRDVMVHLSEVLGLPVHDADGLRVGRVDDLRVDSHRGAVDSLVVRARGESRSVPWSAVASFSPEHRRVGLAAGSAPTLWNGGESETSCLKRDVLDPQIIDTQGRKVVRVNDIALQTAGELLVLKRVEVGLARAVP